MAPGDGPSPETEAASIRLKAEELTLLLGGIELEKTRFKDW